MCRQDLAQLTFDAQDRLEKLEKDPNARWFALLAARIEYNELANALAEQDKRVAAQLMLNGSGYTYESHDEKNAFKKFMEDHDAAIANRMSLRRRAKDYFGDIARSSRNSVQQAYGATRSRVGDSYGSMKNGWSAFKNWFKRKFYSADIKVGNVR